MANCCIVQLYGENIIWYKNFLGVKSELTWKTIKILKIDAFVSKIVSRLYLGAKVIEEYFDS